MGKTRKKAQSSRVVRLGDKTQSYSVDVFGGSHINYSGFGYHETDKKKAANRRNRRLEEKRAKMGSWD